MRRALCIIAAILLGLPVPTARAATAGPVIFVHGMGTSADEIGTTQFVELLDAVDVDVFRYIEDKAESDAGPNDSQSGVEENATKLAKQIAESAKGNGKVTLVGYSMGGAIIRTYLALHRRAAEANVKTVILLDAVASGSWGYAFATEFPRRFDGSLGARLKEVMRSAAASSASVDLSRPATRDLSPRSALFRRIAPMPLPRNIDYHTFWGDIRVVIKRGLLAYDLPDFELPSLGDLGLLPGDPDPTKLPELGGQRFSPPVDDGHVAEDLAHEARITLDGAVVRDLISVCGQRPTKDGPNCAALAGEQFQIPNTHTAVPVRMDTIELTDGRTLLQAVLEAIG